MFNYLILLTSLLIPLAVQAEWRDPTAPGNFSASPQSSSVAAEVSWNLSEILITDNSKRAIINGATFKTGDTLNDTTRLIKITSGHVVIKQDGMLKKLYLVPSVKKPLK